MAELVRETPTAASTLPAMSSKGVATPRSISTTRWVLSSVTAESIGDAPTMTIMASSITSANGPAIPSSSPFLRAAWILPVFSSLETRLSVSTGTVATKSSKWLWSTPSWLSRTLRSPWPGNVRQLQHLIERLTVLAERIDAEAVREALTIMESREKPVDTLADAEEEQIRRVLSATGGNKSKAAQLLGIERKTLYRKLERMKL